MTDLRAPLLDLGSKRRSQDSPEDGINRRNGSISMEEKRSDDKLRHRRTTVLKQSVLDSQKSHNELLAGRLYAINAPKIFLETITARTTLIIIALTYAVFIVGFSVDIYTTYQGFTSSNSQITAYSCTPKIIKSGGTWGCSSHSQWNSTVTQLTNVLSVQLSVQQSNLTFFFSDIDVNNSFTIEYNVKMWACYENEGCGDSFKYDDSYTDNPSVWQKVLFLDSQSIKINVNQDVTKDNGGTISSTLITNTFQNQESIPTNGLVKSYFLFVQYTSDPYGLYSGTNSLSQTFITYNFDVVTRPQQEAEDALTIVLLVFTILLFIFYVAVIRKQKKVLSEQKWLITYFFLLILFQNPVYCVIVWFHPAATPSAAFASYFLSNFAQSGLFILWLLFADAVHRKTKNRLLFYGPKTVIGFLIFLTSLIILTFQFPGLSTSDQRDSLEAVANWSTSLQVEFIVFTLMYLSLIWIWTLVWFIRLYLTARKLNRLPYMATRYIQLSYRFFLLQATLVTVYYVFQYAFVIYFISYGASSSYDATSITDNINTLFRQQTQLFGKTLFLTVYAMILTFLFLPSNLLDRSGIKTALAATYVITEDELAKIVKMRKNVLRNMEKNIVNQVTLMNQIVNAKVDVFCVDIALKLRNASFQAYYDLPHLNTISGYEGASADLNSIGFDLVKYFYIESHEVICYILREKSQQRLLVVFRGTASKKQMEDNLNYTKVRLKLDNTGLLAVDQYDGLNFKESVEMKFDLESISEDDNDELLLDEDIEHGPGRTFSDSMREPGQNERSKEFNNQTVRDTMVQRVESVRDNISKAFTGAVDATGQGIKGVVGLTTDILTSAAANTPGLKGFIGPYVHSGFYNSYLAIRPFIHEVLRIELKKSPTTVFFTGHSLGGALATFAALDVSINTIPRVNAFLKHQEKLKLFNRMQSEGEMFSIPISSASSNSNDLAINPIQGDSTLPGVSNSHLIQQESASFQRSSSSKIRSASNIPQPTFTRKIKAVMYNFGSPRVGNFGFKQIYDRVVPNSFRVVVDGDIVAGLPPSGYEHVGTEILLDSLGAGSIIIDPSFVERWLRTQSKSSVAVHSLIYYQKGLLGLKLAAQYLKQYAKELEGETFDPIQMVVQLRNEHKIEKLVEGHQDLVDSLNSTIAEVGENVSESRIVEKSREDDHSDRNKFALQPTESYRDRSAQIVDIAQVVPRDQLPDLSIQNEVESEDVAVVSHPRTIDEFHYERDERTMNDLLAQIKAVKKSESMRDWLAKGSMKRIQKQKTETVTEDLSGQK